MTTQKISPSPGGGKTRPATGTSDPRVGINKGMAGEGFNGKKNGKVFANMSPGEVSGVGQSTKEPYSTQGGPSLKNSNLHKAPAEDKSSRGENQER